MKILLVELLPRHRLFKSPTWMPTYLTAAAAPLRESGHEVALVERGRLDNEEGFDPAKTRAGFLNRVQECSPDLILFEGRSRVLSDLRDLGRIARDAAPDAVILAGGRYPTLLPEDTLKANDFLDGVIAGEPELALLEIARGVPLDKIPALAFRSEHGVRFNPPGEPLADLDRLPFPAWDLLEMDYHARITPRVIPCLPLSTATITASRGCGNNCTFCSEGRLHARPIRYHSGRYVVEAISKLIRDYGVEGIYFADEMLLGRRESAAEICEELIRAGLGGKVKWTAQVRTDAVDQEILALMRRAGCVQLEFGIESGSQRMLDELRKGTTVEGNLESLQMTREAGIRLLTYIMFALPGETLDDFRMTKAFLRKARPDIVRLIRFIPLPGTPATNSLISDGKMRPGFWEGQVRRGDPFGGERVNLSNMTDEVLAREARNMYRGIVFGAYARDFVREGCLRHFTEIFNISDFMGFLRKRLISTDSA